MTHIDDDSKKIINLRRRAEERTTQEASHVVNASPEEMKRLLHELSVHQIELELQNEELRTTQLELETSRRKYIDLYEISPVGLLVLGQDNRIQEPNLTIATMLGISRHKLVNRELTAFIDPASQDDFHRFYRGLKTTQQPQQCEVVLHSLNQGAVSVRLDGIALVIADYATTYRISVSDLTLQKEAEAQRMELVAEQQRVKVLSDFVRDLSHDIRTRLTTAITSLYLVSKTVDTEKAEKLEKITQYLFQLNTVLDQLQHMAVLDNLTELPLKRESLNRLIIDVIVRFKGQAQAQNVKLIHKLQEDLPDIGLEVNFMDRALSSLIDNALRFTPSKGIISIETFQTDHMVTLQMTDNGNGIDGETLPHIFKRFFKGATSGPRNTSGVGLGLTMARQIIELHHGTINVTSTPGVITTVTIKLPLK